MSVLITANNLNNLQTKLISSLNYMSAYFLVEGLFLTIEKTNVVKFSSDHLQNDLCQITYKNKTTKEATHFKFLGLELEKYMNWKNLIKKKILPKMSSAYYTVRSLYPFSSMTMLTFTQ